MPEQKSGSGFFTPPPNGWDSSRDGVPISPPSPAETPDREMILRRGWWLSHGCVGIYGDDGEMSCGACMIDFKRDDPADIERKIFARGVKAMAEHGSPRAAQPATTDSDDTRRLDRLEAALISATDATTDGEEGFWLMYNNHRSDFPGFYVDLSNRDRPHASSLRLAIDDWYAAPSPTAETKP